MGCRHRQRSSHAYSRPIGQAHPVGTNTRGTMRRKDTAAPAPSAAPQSVRGVQRDAAVESEASAPDSRPGQRAEEQSQRALVLINGQRATRRGVVPACRPHARTAERGRDQRVLSPRTGYVRDIHCILRSDNQGPGRILHLLHQYNVQFMIVWTPLEENTADAPREIPTMDTAPYHAAECSRECKTSM